MAIIARSILFDVVEVSGVAAGRWAWTQLSFSLKLKSSLWGARSLALFLAQAFAQHVFTGLTMTTRQRLALIQSAAAKKMPQTKMRCKPARTGRAQPSVQPSYYDSLGGRFAPQWLRAAAICLGPRGTQWSRRRHSRAPIARQGSDPQRAGTLQSAALRLPNTQSQSPAPPPGYKQ